MNNRKINNDEKGYLKDLNGNKSSKRLWGSILMFSGVACSILLFLNSLLYGAKDPQSAISVVNILLIAGGSLLGVGLFEKSITKEVDKL